MSDSQTRQRVCVLALVVIGITVIFHTLARGSYMYAFILGCVFLLIMAEKMRLSPIAFILLTIAFGDWACELGYLPPQVMWAPELVSGLLLLKVIRKRSCQRRPIQHDGASIWLLFVAVVTISSLVNDSDLISALLFLRLLVRYYFLFLAMINMDLEERELKWINGLVAAIFWAQLPLAGVKMLVLGQGESPLGLNGHSRTTFVVLIALSFLLSYYLLWKPWNKLLLLCLGFLGFGFVGGKRGVVFLIPMLFLYMFWRITKDRVAFIRVVVVACVLGPVGFYLSVRLLPTLNPDRQVWGGFEPVYALEYTIDYTTGRDQDGYATGRVSALVDVFHQLTRAGIWRASLGNGPGSILKSRFAFVDKRDDLRARSGISYGLNGLNWMSLQLGYLGTLVFFLLFRTIEKSALRCFEYDSEPYWRAFGLGMAGFSFIMMFVALFYSPAYADDAISAIYFCLAAVLYTRARNLQRELFFEESVSAPGVVCESL